MKQIILTPDQEKLYYQSTEPVQVCDNHGRVLSVLPPECTPEFIAELKERAKKPGRRFTSAQISRQLQALEEAWAREGPFDINRAREIVEQSRSEDAT